MKLKENRHSLVLILGFSVLDDLDSPLESHLSLCTPSLPLPGTPVTRQWGRAHLFHQTQIWGLSLRVDSNSGPIHKCLFWLYASYYILLLGPGLVVSLTWSQPATWLYLVPPIMKRQAVWGWPKLVHTSRRPLRARYTYQNIIQVLRLRGKL